MNTKMKKELIGDVLTGLMVAATFAAVGPADALAQLSSATGTFQSEVGTPFTTIVSLISYGIGTVLTVAGIAQAKKHADAPQTTPLGLALGRLGAGAAFLAAPYLVKTVMETGNKALSTNSSSFTTISW